MATALARREREQIARPLKVLIPLIRADIEAGNRAGVEHYADAGDKLIEAKDQVSFGHWGAWIRKNFELSQETAQRYMRAARTREAQKLRGPEFLPPSLSQMDGDTVKRRQRRNVAASYQSVLREVEPDAYAIEKQTRNDENQLHRAIAVELIEIGFKALATRLHPDHGGSREAMARLNLVRRELKGVAETRRFV